MRFNADDVPAAAGFGPIPDGTYRVRVDDSNEIENKKGTGKYLELVIIITEGPSKGRKLWARMTSEHENEQAASIGRGQISQASRALGCPAFNHESALKDCVATVRIGRERNDPERNEVKEWIVAPENKGAPTYSHIHQRAGAQQHDIHREERVARPGGQLRESVAQQSSAPPVADMPEYFDDSVPF